MSMVTVFDPSSQTAAFYALNDTIAVNLLGSYNVEFKVLDPQDTLVGAEPFHWDFGDGNQLVDGFEVTHTYGAPGRKTVTVQINTAEGVQTSSLTFDLPGGATVQMTDEPQEEHENEAA